VAAMKAHERDARVHSDAAFALMSLMPALPQLAEPATVAAGRAAADAGAFGALAAALEQAQAEDSSGVDPRLFSCACRALLRLAPHAETSQAAMQPGQAARATEAVCAAVTWSLMDSTRRRDAHARGEDMLHAMQLVQSVIALCNMGGSAPAHADILRAKGVVALLPSLSAQLAQLRRAYTSLDDVRLASSALRNLQDWLLGSCDACGAAAGPAGQALKRCGRCRAVAYCSTDCQRHGWAELGHKSVCGAAAAAGAAASRAASAEH
jgi:hypothetical protein